MFDLQREREIHVMHAQLASKDTILCYLRCLAINYVTFVIPPFNRQYQNTNSPSLSPMFLIKQVGRSL